ncbi:MAG TPA: glycine cleavage system protein GcvH [bacterium]|nr:glycine cleavage system protein GcvH [bacterium]HMW36620.1 glycine cleavage system protein GcvH [bacterium]HMY36973.1 glycine cleavage system protein GcvH [bacterium]HMZ04989.1 glycine cleavage system protein GcvH [bacterium]HNB56815.1 glycine cleavage system protein GcvH [bacterium]
MNFPEELLYAASHEWVRLEGDIATVGVSDYAQSELGDIIFLELPEIGKKVTAGQPFGSVEAVKTVSDLYAPFSGEVIEVNGVLADKAETINSDPYGNGWIVKIKVSDMSAKSSLLSANKYRESTAH